MAWRTVVVSNRAKLDLKYGSMVVRKADDTIKVHIPEISSLIIESTAVSITAALLAELTENKVNVIFCDKSRNPISELVPYYGSHDSSLKIKEQFKWSNEVKAKVWKEIVIQKIKKQRNLLIKYNLEQAELLDKYILEVEDFDKTNREAHAAKVYFNALFGKEFSRSDDSPINAGLNYGYQIILSMFNREVVNSGYLTQIGIFHSNRFNHFNLSSDLMEPYRVLVDEIVAENLFELFGKDEKRIMQELVSKKLYIANKSQYINHAIEMYTKSIFEALKTGDVSKIKEYRNEL